MERPVVFVSYSHRDQAVLSDLLPYLNSLQRQGAASVWTDGQIKAGERWSNEIDDALNSARVAVLLISQEFLASPFVRDEELPRILKRQVEGQLAVLPVFVSPSTVKSASIPVTDATGRRRLITLSDFQGFGTPDETLSELQLPERQRRFVALHNRIRELAHPAKLSIVSDPAGINASSPSRMPVEPSGEHCVGETVMPAISQGVAHAQGLTQTQPHPGSLIRGIHVKLILLLALVVSAAVVAWTLALSTSKRSGLPARSLQEDLKSLAVLTRAKRLKELRGESQFPTDQNPTWTVDPFPLSGASYCYTYLSRVDTNVVNCLFDRVKFPVNDLMAELKRAIPELELVRGAPNQVVFVNDTPYSDWLTFSASGIEIVLCRSVNKPNDIRLSVTEIR